MRQGELGGRRIDLPFSAETCREVVFADCFKRRDEFAACVNRLRATRMKRAPGGETAKVGPTASNNRLPMGSPPAGSPPAGSPPADSRD